MMIRKTFFVCIALAAAASLFSTPDQFNEYFINAAKIAKSSVVNITVYKKKGTGDSALYEKTAYGSGTYLFEDGYIVTNYHVLSKGNHYQVAHEGAQYTLRQFKNGQYYIFDQKTDIALLKVESTKQSMIAPITIADSNALSEGEWVMAVGNPFGLKQSITCGVISYKGRDNVGFTDIEDFIQSDVPINPGNSGGPLVNLCGEMVGLNTAIRTDSGGYQGISFAIPSNIVKQVCYELINFGRVRRGWLGCIIKEKPMRAENERSIVEVITVIKNSPADAAGLQKGDALLEVDGNKVSSMGMVLKYIGSKPIGTKVYLSVSRDGIMQDFKLTLREKHEYEKIRKALQKFFLKYGAEIDENAESDGIIVSYVSPDGIHYGLLEGDVVLSLNSKKINSIDDFVRIFHHAGQSVSNIIVKRESRILNINMNK